MLKLISSPNFSFQMLPPQVITSHPHLKLDIIAALHICSSQLSRRSLATIGFG